jgi:hypothetical protein
VRNGDWILVFIKRAWVWDFPWVMRRVGSAVFTPLPNKLQLVNGRLIRKQPPSLWKVVDLAMKALTPSPGTFK